MDEYMEVYDNTEPEDAWWNEEQEDTELSVPDDAVSALEETEENTVLLDELIETLNSSQSYGSMGDYYNQVLGCYVFPDFDVYAYFIDIDADGADWAETSDGHYVPVLYLEAYEENISAGDDTEEIQPTESEIQTLETLEGVRGMLSVIKENNTIFYDSVLAYEEEMLTCSQETLVYEQKMLAYTEGIFYSLVTGCILLGMIAGIFMSHVFFGRMRVG